MYRSGRVVPLWFQGSVVSYSNSSQEPMCLGVADVVLEQHGAVSVECAQAMAPRRTTAVTNGSGGEYKPVLLAQMAWNTSKAGRHGVFLGFFAIAKSLYSDIQYFNGDRQQIRAQALCPCIS